MLKNYFLIAIRNLTKNISFSLINILGLSFGLGCFLLISLWILDELAYDKFHSDIDNIYKVYADMGTISGSSSVWHTTPANMGPVLKEYSEVDQICRVTPPSGILAKRDTIRFQETGYFADPNFFRFFTFPLTGGMDPATVLADPYDIVISRSFASKFFGDQDPVGESLQVINQDVEETYRITAVFEDIPDQSSLKFDFIIGYESYERHRPWNKDWENFNLITFLKLSAGVEPDAAENSFGKMMERFIEDEEIDLFIRTFGDFHLRSNFDDARVATGRIQYIRQFQVIAIFILLIAGINFMSLSTAKSWSRAREVGVRKVFGAGRMSLFFQFIGESILLSLVAVAGALLLAQISLPLFNFLVKKNLALPYGQWEFWTVLLLIGVITGFLAGSYPALYVSSFIPSRALAGKLKSSGALLGFRRVLIIIQFSISIVLMISTLVIYKQIEYIRSKDLGLEKDNVLFFGYYDGIRKNPDFFRSEIEAIPGVSSVTFSTHNPIQVSTITTGPTWKGKPEGLDVGFYAIETDHQFVPTFGLEVIEGRNFPEDNPGGNNYYLINEEAARVMGMDDPLGEQISGWNPDPGEIIGVVKDFHHVSFFQQIEPVIIRLNPDATWIVFVKLSGGVDLGSTLTQIESVYTGLEPNYPFSYRFVDEDFNRIYSTVASTGSLALVFSVIAIIISCMGLFALSLFMTEKRTKETGVRKAMGASVANLLLHYSKNYLLLVVLSFLVSIPVTIYFTRVWLLNFAYKTELGLPEFVAGGLLAVVIALTTISFQTVKLALRNPADSLRYE